MKRDELLKLADDIDLSIERLSESRGAYFSETLKEAMAAKTSKGVSAILRALASMEES